MKLEKAKKLEITKIGRKYVEAKDLAYNGKKVQIVMNENFDKDTAKENLNKVVKLDAYVEFEQVRGYWKIKLYPVDLEKLNKKAEEKAVSDEIARLRKGITTMLYYIEKSYNEGKTYQNGINVVKENLEKIQKLSKKDETEYAEKISAELKRLEVVEIENTDELKLVRDFEEPFTVGQEFTLDGKKVRVKKEWKGIEEDALSFGGWEDNQRCYFALVEVIEENTEFEKLEKRIRRHKSEEETEMLISFFKDNKSFLENYRKDNGKITGAVNKYFFASKNEKDLKFLTKKEKFLKYKDCYIIFREFEKEEK